MTAAEVLKQMRAKRFHAADGSHGVVEVDHKLCLAADTIEAELAAKDARIAELEGQVARYIALTRSLEEHPEGFDDACECATCLSYGDAP